MGNCLITKINASVNVELERLGEVSFVKEETSSDVTIAIWGKGYARGIGVTFLVEGEYIDRVELGTITVSKDAGYIVIEDKYDLTSINLDVYNSKVNVPADKLRYMGGGNCVITNARLSGDLTGCMKYINGTPSNIYMANSYGELTEEDYYELGSKVKSLDLSKFNGNTIIVSKLFESSSIIEKLILGTNNKLEGKLDDLYTAPKLSYVAVDSKSSFKIEWASADLRPSNLPIIRVDYSPNFKSEVDVDNYLINMSNCTAVNIGRININTARTSNSDNAILKLKSMGYTIAIKNILQ